MRKIFGKLVGKPQEAPKEPTPDRPLSLDELASVSGGKKLPGKKKPPTLTL